MGPQVEQYVQVSSGQDRQQKKKKKNQRRGLLISDSLCCGLNSVKDIEVNGLPTFSSAM